MERFSKENFRYARLFTPDTGEYVTDASRDGLVMGPETARRFAENAGDVAVTVCCITYGHEQFIAQALESFVMQKTSFRFRVFVGEDCGPDRTAEIVRAYAEKYPDIIVPFIRERNLGAQRNLADLCERAESPYIAWCEGDDYWTDEYKLQKQFDYMQQNEDVRMCYTRTRIDAPANWHLNGWYVPNAEGQRILPDCTPGFPVKPYYTVTDFIQFFPSHTSSVFFRWDYDLAAPGWYFEGLVGDTPMMIMQLGMGRAVYLPDVTSVYRRTEAGVFMSKNTPEHFARTRLDYLRFLRGLREYYRTHFNDYACNLFRRRITQEVANYLATARKMNDPSMVAKLAAEYPDETFDALKTFIDAYKASQGGK